MKTQPNPGVAWVHEGAWAVVSSLFRVPREGPSLPAHHSEQVQQFHPAPAYLGYLKLWFWLVMAGTTVVFAGLTLVVWFEKGRWAVPVGLGLAALLLAAGVVAYVAIHLRYDNMWYVMTDRSLRIRRGIVVITEVTLTFENVQNVRVMRGPVQRLFGIADVTVETAGAGADAQRHQHRPVTNQGLIQGIADADRIRDQVMTRVRRSTTTGLGDEPSHLPARHRLGLTGAHLEVLREIRDQAITLAGAASNPAGGTPPDA